ncbi:MAG: response regulator [Candidatus Fimadaptatus sp.]
MNEWVNNASCQERAIQDILNDCLLAQEGRIEQTVASVLAELGRHYSADRAYIFEAEGETGHMGSVYEWRGEGVASCADSLKHMLPDERRQWLKRLERQDGPFLFDASSADAGHMPLLPGTGRVLAAPVRARGRIRGFLGVDNPRRNAGDTLLLSVAASACCREISTRRRENARLEQTEREMTDRVNRGLADQKRLHETNENLTTLLAQEKQYTAIIGAISNVYSGLYYIDLDRNTFQELISLDRIHHTLGEKGNAREALRHMTRELAGDAYQALMLKFTDFDTIGERLGDKPIIIQEYAARSGGWTRCSFIPVERDADGRNRTVMCMLRSVTAEKEVESQGNLIQALAIPYENIYTVNADTREAICYRMGQTMTERYGRRFAAGNYEYNIQTYVANDVLADDRQLFDQVITVDGVNALLADRKAYYFNYRTLRDGVTQYFQCQLVKPNPDRNEFVIGFKNINEEKNIELAAQRRVEEALAAVEKANAVLKDEMEIAGTLSRDYPDVVLVDLDEETAVTIKRRGSIIAEDQRVVRRSYRATWDYYIHKYVLEEDRAALYDAISVESVRRALEKGDEYSCSYRVVADETGVHHYQASFFRFYSRHEAESQLILGFRCVDAIVEEERKNRTIQEEQLRVIGALSQEYSSLFKIDARTRRMTLYRTDGKAFEPETLNRLLALGDYELILSKYIDAFVVPEDRERIRESIGFDVLMDRIPEVGLYKLGYRRIMKGAVAYFEMNMVKTVDPSGTVTFILGLRDVDEEARRQLKQTYEMEVQRDIIDGLGSEYYSVLLLDPEKDTVAFFRATKEHDASTRELLLRNQNRWSEIMRSYAAEQVCERSRAEYLEKLSPEYIRARDEDYSVNIEVTTEGEIHYLQLRVAYVHEAGGNRLVVIGTRNVDDLIVKERQQEMALKAAFDAAEAASRAKTDFLSHMSHDIRTPMNGIIGMTAIAAAHIDDRERVQDCLKKITQASKHLLSLINEVLDMSKIESGKVDLMEEEFNLSELIDNLITMTGPQVAEHGHELSVNISGVVHEAVVGDSLRIQKVLTNLMGNAVKYTPDGGRIMISITEKPSLHPKVGCFEVVFEDNGIGMSEEFQQQIFEPFTRSSDDEHVNRVQGTGLGMAISRNIVRMMGGDIKVESKLGEGSRFTVTMYLKLQDAEVAHYEQFVDLDVLVTDDDDISLESCCMMLNDLGMRAEGVSSGAETVERVVARHSMGREYFACIIDWKMPDMDGIATTRAIRQAVGKDVPIIIISAYDWSDIEQEAREAGANAFISKPLFRSRLVNIFSSLVERNEPGAQETPFAQLETVDLAGGRVLLAEDNELNAEIAAEILEMTGLSVERVADGIEAVERMAGCEDGYFDMVFMDIQMPRMNGYDATRAIRAMDRSYCRSVPIIAMTANAFAEDVHAAREAGMNEHIAKPLDMNALARILKRWVL